MKIDLVKSSCVNFFKNKERNNCKPDRGCYFYKLKNKNNNKIIQGAILIARFFKMINLSYNLNLEPKTKFVYQHILHITSHLIFLTQVQYEY